MADIDYDNDALIQRETQLIDIRYIRRRLKRLRCASDGWRYHRRRKC